MVIYGVIPVLLPAPSLMKMCGPCVVPQLHVCRPLSVPVQRVNLSAGAGDR